MTDCEFAHELSWTFFFVCNSLCMSSLMSRVVCMHSPHKTLKWFNLTAPLKEHLKLLSYRVRSFKIFKRKLQFCRANIRDKLEVRRKSIWIVPNGHFSLHYFINDKEINLNWIHKLRRLNRLFHKLKFCFIKLTFFLSLIDPLPLTMILHPVSCSSCFAVIPRGPNILPTKLNCKK